MRATRIVLLACLCAAVPAAATDFYFHLSWEKEADATHATARPGDTLSVFIRVDTLEYWQMLTLDHVAFGLWSDCALSHVETKSLDEDIGVTWNDQGGCRVVDWTPKHCGVRIAEITQYVSEHRLRVDATQDPGAGYRVTSWCPDFVEPLIWYWEHNDCTGYLGEMFAVCHQLTLDVVVPNESSAWGSVKALYRAP